jgi:hypothetical protein
MLKAHIFMNRQHYDFQHDYSNDSRTLTDENGAVIYTVDSSLNVFDWTNTHLGFIRVAPNGNWFFYSAGEPLIDSGVEGLDMGWQKLWLAEIRIVSSLAEGL